MIADASFAEKCRWRVAYKTSVEYRTANPRVEKIWMKNRAAVVVLVGPAVEYRRADRTKDYTLVVSKVTKLWP